MTIVQCGIMGDMANLDINDTTPITVTPPEAEKPAPQGKKRSPLKMITIIGILTLLLIGVFSAYAGYAAGIDQRKEAETALTTVKSSEQFDLAVKDINDGQYQRARQRLEYIAQLDPNFPGLTEQLAIVLARINATATPTPEPTPTIVPTVDARGAQDLYSQAQQLMANGDWSNAIDTILKLRKNDPGANPVQLDGMLFMALRNRALDKIAKQADLEGGLYDLSQAENFGPLDADAQGYITWVSLYITGASFWDLDWAKVVEYFSQVGPALPGLTDRSGWTARERYRLGLKGYGETLASSGDACAAAEQFQLSLSVGADPEVEQLLTDALNTCQGAVTEEAPAEQQPAAATEVLPGPVPTVPPVETTEPPVEPTPYPAPGG